MGHLLQHRVWVLKVHPPAKQVLVLIVVLLFGTLAHAQTFTVLYSFSYGSDGYYPVAGVTRDAAGNLYGTTTRGGSNGGGVVYKMSKRGKLTVLYRFAGGASDGCYPIGRPAMDAAGNLYGTTYECGVYGYGTVWKLSKKGIETILYNATDAAKWSYPEAGVILDSNGNIYGTASYGGDNFFGSVYKLSQSGKLTLLHKFEPSGGEYPMCGLWRDEKGRLYGTTNQGGSVGPGTVWSLTP